MSPFVEEDTEAKKATVACQGHTTAKVGGTGIEPRQRGSQARVPHHGGILKESRPAINVNCGVVI